MLVSLGGAQTWRPEINENIWNTLPLFKRLLFSLEPLYFHINCPPSTLTVQTVQNHKKSPFLHKRKLFHGCYVGVRSVRSLQTIVGKQLQSGPSVTLIPKWRKILYFSVSMLIGPLLPRFRDRSISIGGGGPEHRGGGSLCFQPFQ